MPFPPPVTRVPCVWVTRTADGGLTSTIVVAEGRVVRMAWTKRARVLYWIDTFNAGVTDAGTS